MNRNRLAIAVTITLCIGVVVCAGDNGEQQKRDQAKVRNYLKKKFPNKKWQQGPAPVKSKEVQQIFGKGRYYFVFSATPLPPGANIKGLIDAYRRRVEEINKHHLRLSVRIDPAGKITPFQTVDDFRQKLKPVKNDNDAKVVAAAVLSLYGSGRVSPGPVAPKSVSLRRSSAGDLIATARPNRFSMGFVIFDKKGVLKGVSKRYAGPLPP